MFCNLLYLFLFIEVVQHFGQRPLFLNVLHK
uniref:Uncharacterized protein n=1 Tax=Anguilla anguilla TaxID=7936 RepID=A0A0E9S221_ANGAN